jgi:hypothetical protein
MIRDADYGVYKISDSEDAIVFIGHTSGTLNQAEDEIRSGSNQLALDLANIGSSWTFSWMLGPKRTSSAQIAKLATGLISRNNPKYN